MATKRKQVSDNPLRAVYEAKSRTRCSKPLFRYLKRQREIFDSFFFITQLATGTDKARITAAKALAVADETKYGKKLSEIENNPDPAMKRLRSHARLFAENLLIRSVDNFLSYLSDIIHLAMEKQPDLLRSKEEIRLEELLDFDSYDDLISALIDRKVTRLAYQGLDGLSEFINSRLGLALHDNDIERVLLTISIELRNIYLHNRGLVSEITLNRLKKIEHSFEFKKGATFYADFDQLAEFSNNMATVAKRLDARVCSKLELKRSAYATHDRTAT